MHKREVVYVSLCGLTHIRCTTVAECARTLCTDLAQAVQLHLNRPAEPSVSAFILHILQVFQCFLSAVSLHDTAATGGGGEGRGGGLTESL